jgi:CheY-like chemotaxis protein
MASILIVDDDQAVRHMMRRALERAGHHVSEAPDGAEGMRLYRAAPTDLVITDLYMPGQDGIETIQQLRDEFPHSRIVAMSGGASASADGPLQDAAMFGADATLAKPFTMQRLTDVVAEILRDG